MALLTPLPFESARTLLDAYGLRLAKLVPLAAGSVNSNFLLETECGSGYFARIYEEQGPEGATFEIQLNLRLAEAGVPVARPLLPRAGGSFVLHGAKPFAVYEKLDGESLCQKRVTPSIARSLGAALARVHTSNLAGLEVPEGRFGASQLRERLLRVRDSGREELLPAVERIESILDDVEAARRARETLSGSLPSGLIHGDLFRDNALVRDEAIVGLLDFESACRGAFVYDLAVTILAWCYGDSLNLETARAMIEGYRSVRPFEESEVTGITLEASFACARFATTRLTDFSLRAAPGEAPLRDYRRFFARLDEVQTGILERLCRVVD